MSEKMQISEDEAKNIVQAMEVAYDEGVPSDPDMLARIKTAYPDIPIPEWLLRGWKPQPIPPGV